MGSIFAAIKRVQHVGLRFLRRKYALSTCRGRLARGSTFTRCSTCTQPRECLPSSLPALTKFAKAALRAAVQAKKLRRQPSGSARWSRRTKITTSERCCTWFWPWWWPFARQSLARRDLPLWPTVRWHSLLHERVSHVSLRMRPLTEQWG